MTLWDISNKEDQWIKALQCSEGQHSRNLEETAGMSRVHIAIFLVMYTQDLNLDRLSGPAVAMPAPLGNHPVDPHDAHDLMNYIE